MITFHDLLKSYGVDPQCVRVVRHGNKEINVLDVFQNNKERFNQYCSWQKENKYGKSKYLAVFAPARGTTSLFLGMWAVEGVTKNNELQKKHLRMLVKNDLPQHWFGEHVYYHLKITELMSDLSERLVIEWGKSTLNWVQIKDKNIVQIKPKNSIDDFSSYDDIQLSYSDLKKLMRDSDSNTSWVNALSSVNGVYLILNKTDGRLYVGSAYGKDGILGRWSAYSKSGHGDNKLLKALDPENFEFSVLEITPLVMSIDEVIDRENRWKVRLATREFGLNDN